MKTRIHLFALAFILSCTSMTTAQAATSTLTHEQTEARIAQIKDRVDQIKAMDYTHLSKSDRTNVRHELKDMKKELSTMEPYIYISAGAVILIIILLLILL